MLKAIPNFETARAFAAVLILSVFSVVLFGLLALAERRLLPWADQPRGTAGTVVAVPCPPCLPCWPSRPGSPPAVRRRSRRAAARRERVDLVLDYLPNADHAGIYAAIDTGEFKTAKLDITPRTPSTRRRR